MTVLMTLVGVLVFIVSCFTVKFKRAWKRLMLFAVTGLIIDAFIIGIALFTAIVLMY